MSEVVAVTRRDDSPLGTVYRGVLSLADADEDTRLHVASRQVTSATRALKRYVWLSGRSAAWRRSSASSARWSASIRAFENMAATGLGRFAVVAAGISEALIATAAGPSSACSRSSRTTPSSSGSATPPPTSASGPTTSSATRTSDPDARLEPRQRGFSLTPATATSRSSPRSTSRRDGHFLAPHHLQR